MTTLTVLKCAIDSGALQMESTLLDLQKQKVLDVLDAVTVTWPQGAYKPKTQELNSLSGPDALSDTFWFWGMLFAMLFFAPVLGLDIDGSTVALAGKFADYGINDIIIKQIQENVTQGTSALFLLTTSAVLDKVVAALNGQSFEVISTSLPKEKEDELHAGFGVD